MVRELKISGVKFYFKNFKAIFKLIIIYSYVLSNSCHLLVSLKRKLVAKGVGDGVWMKCISKDSCGIA